MLEMVSMQWDVRSAANLRMPRVTSDIMNIANASVHRRDSESRNTPPACAARQHEPGMATGCYWNSHKIPAHAVKFPNLLNTSLPKRGLLTDPSTQAYQ